jgi:hypothetical protein
MILLVIVLSVIYLLVTLYIVSTFIIFCVIRGGAFSRHGVRGNYFIVILADYVPL